MTIPWLSLGSHKNRLYCFTNVEKLLLAENKTSFKDKLILYKINYDVLAQTFSLAAAQKQVTISFNLRLIQNTHISCWHDCTHFFCKLSVRDSMPRDGQWKFFRSLQPNINTRLQYLSSNHSESCYIQLAFPLYYTQRCLYRKS